MVKGVVGGCRPGNGAAGSGMNWNDTAGAPLLLLVASGYSRGEGAGGEFGSLPPGKVSAAGVMKCERYARGSVDPGGARQFAGFSAFRLFDLSGSWRGARCGGWRGAVRCGGSPLPARGRVLVRRRVLGGPSPGALTPSGGGAGVGEEGDCRML